MLTGERDWHYGLFRLSSAALLIDLDGKAAAEIPRFTNYSSTAPCTAARHTVPLPE